MHGHECFLSYFQIILAGDPKQLGPVLMSPFAKMYGFELSFLERLMDRLPYQRNTQLYSEHGGFNSALVRYKIIQLNVCVCMCARAHCVYVCVCI